MTVTFTCRAGAIADEITFRVNNSPSSEYAHRGFTELDQYQLDGKKIRSLSVKALKDNNNTNISCRAVEPGITYSNVAVLRIQGKLLL